MIINANSLHLPFASGIVQTVVTSPPYYGLRSYLPNGHERKGMELGLEKTPEEYIQNLVMVFREVWRVLRNDGTLWVNLGDSYANSGEGGGGNRKGNEHGQHDSMQIAGRPKTPNGCKPKDLIGIPWMLAFALRADGWYLRSDIIWSKPNPMPESVTDRPTKSHEYLFLLSKQAKYFYDADAIREENSETSHTGGQYRNDWKYSSIKNIGDKSAMRVGVPIPRNGRNARTVWTIATQPTSEAHFATYPEKLVEPCILAGSKPGDLVLDPFMGSGTTARVAYRLGRTPIGTELNFKYIDEIAHNRTTVQMGMGL